MNAPVVEKLTTHTKHMMGTPQHNKYTAKTMIGLQRGHMTGLTGHIALEVGTAILWKFAIIWLKDMFYVNSHISRMA